MNPIDWAKNNKEQLVAKVVGNTCPTKNDRPIAIFAAGLPGAGKTEFLDRLLDGIPNIVRIDMDEIVKLFDGYSPQEYYKFRGAANIIVDESVIYCRKNKLDFILDGTFGSNRAIDNVRSALKRHAVVIFYVWKDPVMAWQHTIDRQLVTKRGIDKGGFMEACANIPKNLKDIRSKFSSKISLYMIRKDLKNDSFQVSSGLDEIDKVLEVSYTQSQLERIL